MFGVANDDIFVGLEDAESVAELNSEHVKVHLNPTLKSVKEVVFKAGI